MLKCLVNERGYINCLKIFASLICKKQIIGLVEEMFSKKFYMLPNKNVSIVQFYEHLVWLQKNQTFLFDSWFRFTKSCQDTTCTQPVSLFLTS